MRQWRQCDCQCHEMSTTFARCSPQYESQGGCGHLHRNERRPDLREAAIALGGALSPGLTGTPLPQPAHVAPVAVTAPEPRQERPAGACVTHLPPRPGYHWRRADDGYLTCSDCYDQMHKWLSPFGRGDDGRADNIPILYLTLDPRPGNSGPGRRSPGFGSRSPASDHVIAMRDSRTVQVADKDPCSAAGVLRQWVLWVWDERYDDEALDHSDYRQRRQELPTTVDGAAVWLDKQLDWITRRDAVAEFYDELRELRRQLRGVTGEGGQKPVGRCIEILDTGECRAPIYMPKGEKPRALDEPIKDLPELRCPACDSRYTGRRLILLRVASQKATVGAGSPAA